MIKNISLLFIFLIIIGKTIAQDCGYVEYYPLFELATKNYSEKNYKEAENNIRLAFDKVEFPLGEGLQLALQIAEKQKDKEWMEQIAVQLAKGGVPLRYFRFLKKYDWYHTFNSNFETYSHFYNENFHPELREELVSQINRDKSFNDMYHDWRTRKIELTIEELIEGASQIMLDFKVLTDQYGFPNEQLTGYNYVRRIDKIEYFHTDVLIVHIYQRGVIIFKNEIHEIICKGGLHPNYEEILMKIGRSENNTGVEQEMKKRYKKYRGNE